MSSQYLSQTQQQKQLQTLAPQLRQSLELLQVPMLELRALISQELNANPALDEQLLENHEQIEIEPGSGGEEEEESKELEFKEEYERLSKLDDEWRDYFRQTSVPKPSRTDEDAKRQFFLESLTEEESLQEHLIKQLSYSRLNKEDALIGEMIIGSIDDDGFLSSSLEELAETCSYEVSRLEKVLREIQDFDPIGVGARNIQECLLIQLKRLGMENSIEAEIVQNYFRMLGTKKYPEIAKVFKITLEEVVLIADFVATLEPKPGRMFSSESTAFVHPELSVNKSNGSFSVTSNDDYLPHLRINRMYRKLMENPDTRPEVRSYIREKIRTGSYFIQSIQQRQKTIQSIAEEIVKVQTAFFEKGVAHLKPLTMGEISSVLGIHETTVSRAIANKYIQTPTGVFELKYFFTPGYKTSDGKQISNKSIKDVIANLITNENSEKPLADQAILKKLKELGINVARRTIAKYREELNILPSHMRKSF